MSGGGGCGGDGRPCAHHSGFANGEPATAPSGHGAHPMPCLKTDLLNGAPVSDPSHEFVLDHPLSTPAMRIVRVDAVWAKSRRR